MCHRLRKRWDENTPSSKGPHSVRTALGIITEGWESGGYLRVGINGKMPYVHQLVADAFLPPPPSEAETQVNHKDGDPANNCADNLAWVTRSENVRHSYATNAERKSSAPKRSKAVLARNTARRRSGWSTSR